LIDRSSIGWARAGASLAALAVLAALVATPSLLGSRVEESMSAISGAQTNWLWAAGAAFALAQLCSAFAWRAAAAASGGRLSRRDSAARYVTGSLVNSLAPAHLGDAVRVALFARAIGGPDPVWTAGGVYAAMGAARCLVLAVVLVVTSACGVLPFWPVLILFGVVIVLAGVAFVERNDSKHRFARAFRVIAALQSSPRAAAPVLGWTMASMLARIAAAAAIATALGVPHPILAALVIVPALGLANIFPITPGNLGVASGAVAVALTTRGIGTTQALSAGIALSAVETFVGLAVGATGALYLGRSAGGALRVVGAATSIVLAGVLGVTVLDLV
jgi:uncharacterized membrane protein YbhN (UPF0104 family)